MDKFPRWKYRGAEACIVQDEAEEAALGPHWGDVPGYVEQAELSRAELIEKATKIGLKIDKRWGDDRLRQELLKQ